VRERGSGRITVGTTNGGEGGNKAVVLEKARSLKKYASKRSEKQGDKRGHAGIEEKKTGGSYP